MNQTIRILLAEKSSFSEAGLAAFAHLGFIKADDLTQETLADELPDYQVLVVRLGLRVTEAVLAQARDLHFIVTPTTGLDHINLEAARHREIEVISLKGEREFLNQVYATAEHTMALLLSLVRHIPAAFESVKGGGWRRDIFRGRELGEKTIGIIGCGRLGSLVAGYAQGFKMHAQAYDPYLDMLPPGVRRSVTLEGLLATSDIVSLHVPLNEETYGMIGARELALIKPGAVLINTARGRVVDETALLEALASDRLAGAAVDVLVDEEQITSGTDRPLLRYARAHNNLIITPHIGGATYESVEKADLFVANKLAARLGISPRQEQNL